MVPKLDVLFSYIQTSGLGDRISDAVSRSHENQKGSSIFWGGGGGAISFGFLNPVPYLGRSLYYNRPKCDNEHIGACLRGRGGGGNALTCTNLYLCLFGAREGWIRGWIETHQDSRQGIMDAIFPSYLPIAPHAP